MHLCIITVKKAIDTMHVFPYHPLARDFTDEEGTTSETLCPSSTSSLSDDMGGSRNACGRCLCTLGRWPSKNGKAKPSADIPIAAER
jgi:hypothetical protein